MERMMTRPAGLAVMVVLMLVVSACTSEGTADTEAPGTTASAPTTTTPEPTTTIVAQTSTTTAPDEGGHDHAGAVADSADIATAARANAAFQEVAMAEAAGYASTIGDLGCFESADDGGMGLHYLNGALMDAEVDISTPEALVYEMDSNGEIAGLVAHEYIVPVDAWTEETPPSLFGVDFHQHSVLPLWVLHAWIWKDNPTGMFQDWNPKVRMCPDGVPIFGVDLP